MNRQDISSKGLVYVFTGDGKGKTSAALGVAVRAVGAGMNVGWVAWYKQASWGVSEFQLPKLLKNFHMYLMGEGFRITNHESRVTNQVGKEIKIASVGAGKVVDTATEIEHRVAAQAALEKAASMLRKVDVLVFDEVNNAIEDELIAVDEVIEVIKRRGKTHVILTGRGAHPKIIAVADLVTEMKKIKHPFDKGKMAVKGLDY